MNKTHISVGWYPGFPHRRYYRFNEKGAKIDLKVHVDRLTLGLEAVDGVRVADVMADRDTVTILQVKGEGEREWDQIEKDLAKVFRDTLGVRPHFLYSEQSL